MEKGGGRGNDPATSAAGGMCDRFLTFLARNLTMSRVKSIAEGPRNGGPGGGAGHPPPEGGEEGEEEKDEFAIPIERAEFDDYEFAGHGDGGYSTVPTILEESAAATATKTGAAAADAPASAAGQAPPAVAAVEEKETKVRKTVTIKEDRAEQEGGGAPAAATLERKRSLFKKRQASSAAGGDGGGGEQQGGAAARVPRRAGLRPRMPPALRVPSNINERSSTFIEERRKSFGGRGGKTPATDK